MHLKITAVLISLLCFSCKQKGDCVHFNKELPKFSNQDLVLAEKYLPQIVNVKPSTILNFYLSEISHSKEGFSFRFEYLDHLRSHDCPNSESIEIMLDGEFSFAIDTLRGIISYDPGESGEKPFEFKAR